MSLPKVSKPFKCPTCGKEYSHRKSFRHHREAHNDALHACDQCDKKYKMRGSLLEHIRNAHTETGQFICDECGKSCPYKKALYAHKRWVHSGRLFECPICGKTMSPGSSSYHMAVHAGHSCECDVCGKVCPNTAALGNHKRREHSEAKQRCQHCGKVFRWASDLRMHVVIHDEKRDEYRCGLCPRTFKTRKGHEHHRRIEHSDTRFTCDSECELNSATRSEYRDHLQSHHAQHHPVTCKCLSLDVVRARYIATCFDNTTLVEVGGTLKCSDGGCDFATTCARLMESHKHQCHDAAYQPVLRCTSCETWFSCPPTLKSHIADKHQGERRFKCDRCGYITNGQTSFNRHQPKCQQGKALGNLRLKRAKLATKKLGVKKQSPHAVYQFVSMIGKGGFGRVYEAVKKGEEGEDPRVKYAIKEVGPNGGKSAELEAKCMRQFEHKNVMALLEYYECEKKGRLTRFIVMECCRPGSLTTMQKLVQFQFEEPHVLYVLKEVTCGLEHLHSAGVIHRDLKSANVLVNEGGEVKIADFGVSTDERIAFICRGTPGWEAPEVVAAALTGITGLKSAYTQKADVYSVGVMVVDCFLPRETLPTDFFHKTKVESEFFAETQLQRIEDDRHLRLSEALKDLVARRLAPMTTRLTAAAVQKVPVVKKASIEPFKQLVAECLKKQKEKEEKRIRCSAQPIPFFRRSPPATVGILRNVDSLLGPGRAQSESADVYGNVEPLLCGSG
ncbi:Protein kinase [Aphelenchoides avenae]|nr:Protein kinase [Aphelenchus avenae]